MNWDKALNRLNAGNKRFVSDQLAGGQKDKDRRRELTGGQYPYAIILSCADSRVIPELAFDAGLGELFVVRVAGNVANKSSIASIEYAVAHLGTKLIVVLGHEGCGAVSAAMAGGDNGPNLNTLTGYIQSSVAKGGDLAEVVANNAANSAEMLVSESKIIADAVANDNVQIVTGYYNLSSGKVDFTEIETDTEE
jgi:carbonic anhydrase